MSASIRLRLVLLLAGAFLCSNLFSQTPEQDYARAHKVFLAHTADGFFSDDSPEAAAAGQQMWSAVADFIAEQRNRSPAVSSTALDHALCLLTAEPMPAEAIQESAEQQCELSRGDVAHVVDLGPHLLLVSPWAGESGTVFVVWEHDGKSTVLWSIANAGTQRLDRNDLIGAWKADRAGEVCRNKESAYKPGSCGPLYANVGKLPPDEKGRLRFYVDAGYAQQMGSTIGKQTSIWTWDGSHAELQWIGFYEFMIDQAIGTSFDDDKGTLAIGQKGEFRSFYDCGMCIERPMEQGVLVTKSGVEDLGVRSLVPEMDAIDEFLWRLSHGRSTAKVASTQAARLLGSQVRQATRESREIDKTDYSLGMVSDVVRVTKTGAEVCMEADELGTLGVQMRRTADGGYFIAHVSQPSGDAAVCPSPAFEPPAAETTTTSGTPGH